MQQSQIIGISTVSGDCGEKTICIEILKKRRAKTDLLRDAVSQTSKPGLLAITGGEDEASILD